MSRGKKSPFCPECGKPATGNFCQECGASLGGRFCNQCGGKMSPAAGFCNQCGAKAGSVPLVGRGAAAASVVGGKNLPWWIAGAAMFVVIVVVGVNMVQPGPVAPPPTAPFAGSSGGGTPPSLADMTPREAADRLFNRVMQSVSSGDSLGAQQFLPMALDAHDLARPLDHDGLYHLSILNRAAGNLEAAVENAMEVLSENPDHLLALAAAGEASAELGRTEDASVHYSRLLEVYDDQMGTPLQEYLDHSGITQGLRATAQDFLAGR